MIFSLVTLPSTAVASTTEYVTTIITDLWGFIALMIGIPLAFFVTQYLLDMTSQNDRDLLELRGGVDRLNKNIRELENFYDEK